MVNKTIKNSIMLVIGSDNWKFPKHILMESYGDYNESIKYTANKAFEEYKNMTKNNDLKLIDYSYYGNVDVLCK